MKRVLTISTFALVLGVVALMSIPNVHAICSTLAPAIGQTGGSSIDLGAAAADPTFNDGVSPIQASYWRFTAGNPLPALGADNGAWGNDGPGGTSTWFGDFVANGVYATVGVDDHNGPSDGCINGSPDDFGQADDDILLAACGPDGKFFVIAGTSTADSGGVYNLGEPSDPVNVAVNSPQVVITGSQRVPAGGPGVQVTFTTPAVGDFAANYRDYNAGVPLASVFTGVNVYTACVPRGNAAPSRLVPSLDWVAGGSFPLGAANQQVTRDCGPGSWDVFVGTEPKFDGATPFAAGCVSGTTRPVQAGTTVANPSDPAPRNIKKPRGIRPSDGL